MYKLVLPSAGELLTMLSPTGIADSASMRAAESIISCSLSHIWFYVLDEQLDLIGFANQNFMASMERGIMSQPYGYDDSHMSPEAMRFSANYNEIYAIVSKVANFMTAHIQRLMLMDPQIKKLSNKLSHLDYMCNDYLVVTFFNNALEQAAYVQSITGA